jgi:hypothetical protein
MRPWAKFRKAQSDQARDWREEVNVLADAIDVNPCDAAPGIAPEVDDDAMAVEQEGESALRIG